MSMNIKGLDALTTFESEKRINPQKDLVQGFGDVLKDALNKVNMAQLHSEQITHDFVIGNDVELHQVMIATEKANLALQLTMQIRNKVIESYQEIMRMQV